ncbi:Retrieval of early ER protein Rer1 [Artemisia annua]|uniref:Protein RER1 n=1 Tax=Artemisia annua TaxID=35608 RepID=A0A2U1NWF1_ARTAN|nr:Retrieval of early ER protein Rer1 [Artemisia annua]
MDGIKAAATTTLDKWRRLWRYYQIYLDKTVLHARNRWLGTATLAFTLALRVFYLQNGYFIVYCLGVYILLLLTSFLKPLVFPKVDATDGPLLPMKGSDEFRPFIRELSEFDFWYAVTKGFIISILMTFFDVFFFSFYPWPMLLGSWFIMLVITIKYRISSMIKYKYVPFSIGKQVHKSFHFLAVMRLFWG